MFRTVFGFHRTIQRMGSHILLCRNSNREKSCAKGVTTPALEGGLRHDDGDAETGTDFELGGSLSRASGPYSVQVNGHKLLAHQDRNYEEWGNGYSLTYQPGADRQVLSLELGPTRGAVHSGVYQ